MANEINHKDEKRHRTTEVMDTIPTSAGGASFKKPDSQHAAQLSSVYGSAAGSVRNKTKLPSLSSGFSKRAPVGNVAAPNSIDSVIGSSAREASTGHYLKTHSQSKRVSARLDMAGYSTEQDTIAAGSSNQMDFEMSLRRILDEDPKQTEFQK